MSDSRSKRFGDLVPGDVVAFFSASYIVTGAAVTLSDEKASVQLASTSGHLIGELEHRPNRRVRVRPPDAF